MARRYSRSEKEKWQAPSEPPAKRPPVRIPANDCEDLIEANRLTIIGRLTNPLVQKPRAVIDFMAQVWNLEGRMEGRVLGLDKFQVKFQTEDDLLQVLEKGPYHYKRWMLLLQQWEPTVSDQFPSTISFHVRIHGIPLHFWSKGTILTIGKELGVCSVKDVKEAKIWVEVNGLMPLVMKMEIELPTDDVTEVEFEYIKIEKHCFTCYSLFHEETDCPQRPRNALPPKERVLGITQNIALQRIEAEKRRHDDRRGYRRTNDLRSTIKPNTDSYLPRRDRATSRSYYTQSNDQRGQSILSRTARSNSGSYRHDAPSVQYRVVDKSRHSSGSSGFHHNTETRAVRAVGTEITGTTPIPQVERNTPNSARMEVTPTRNLQDRLGVPLNGLEGSLSGSRERRSALERLSEPTINPPTRVPPSFESGRLQEADTMIEGDEQNEHAAVEAPTQEPDRVPAALRLGGSSAEQRRSGRAIPIAPQSKAAGKRKVLTRKRIARSPLQTLLQRKPRTVRSSPIATRRKLVVDKDSDIPCNKAGTSNQRKKTGPPTTVFIPGSTRGGVDFRPHQDPLP